MQTTCGKNYFINIGLHLPLFNFFLIPKIKVRQVRNPMNKKNLKIDGLKLYAKKNDL